MTTSAAGIRGGTEGPLRLLPIQPKRSGHERPISGSILPPPPPPSVMVTLRRRRSSVAEPSVNTSLKRRSMASQLLARYRRSSLQESGAATFKTEEHFCTVTPSSTTTAVFIHEHHQRPHRRGHKLGLPIWPNLHVLSRSGSGSGGAANDSHSDDTDRVEAARDRPEYSGCSHEDPIQSSSRHDDPREGPPGSTSSPPLEQTQRRHDPAPSRPPRTGGRRRFGTILREHPHEELALFREEAEYSDYLDALVTGAHAEMDSVVFYQLEVHLSQMKWTVLRRFSEFRQLRQRLIKHLGRRQRVQLGGKCPICANILQTIETLAFPSRTQQKPWFPALRSRWSRRYATRAAVIVADRKRKLQDFITVCLLTVRGLRQHSRLMCDSSHCEISVSMRMIEEFLGLSFTRYMRFLNERGIIEGHGTQDKMGSHSSKTLDASSTQKDPQRQGANGGHHQNAAPMAGVPHAADFLHVSTQRRATVVAV